MTISTDIILKLFGVSFKGYQISYDVFVRTGKIVTQLLKVFSMFNDYYNK